MATIADISSTVRAPQVRSPLDSLQSAIQIADMVAVTNQRQQEAKQRREEEPVRKAELSLRKQQVEAAEKQLREKNILDQAFNQSVRFNEQSGDVEFDRVKGASLLKSQGADHLLPTFAEQVNTRSAVLRKQLLEEANTAIETTKAEGQIAETFLANDEPARAENYINLRRTLVQMDPSLAATLPQKYDETVAKSLEGVVAQRKQLMTVKERLEEAQTKAAAAQLAEQELDADTLWKKHNPDGGEMPVWFRNSIAARKAGISAPPASTYRDVKLTSRPMPGDKLPVGAKDYDGNPIPEDWRTADNQFEERQSPEGERYFAPTVGFAKTSKEKENERIEAAYAFSIGTTRDKLDPEQRVKADAWYQGMTPQKKTEFDKRLSLYEKDKSTYSALYGHGADKEITSAQKATILGRIQNNMRQQGLRGDKAKQYYEERRAEMKEAGIDLPAYAGGAAAPPAPGPQAGRTATKAQVEAAAKTSKISYDAAKKQLEAAGVKVVE